jgi:hypothetical protein
MSQKNPPFYVSFQYLCAIVFVFRNVYVLFHKYANVLFYYRDYQEKPAIPPPQYNNRPSLKPDTIEKSKRILGRHFDVYALKSEWLGWGIMLLLLSCNICL